MKKRNTYKKDLYRQYKGIPLRCGPVSQKSNVSIFCGIRVNVIKGTEMTLSYIFYQLATAFLSHINLCILSNPFIMFSLQYILPTIVPAKYWCPDIISRHSIRVWLDHSKLYKSFREYSFVCIVLEFNFSALDLLAFAMFDEVKHAQIQCIFVL